MKNFIIFTMISVSFIFMSLYTMKTVPAKVTQAYELIVVREYQEM